MTTPTQRALFPRLVQDAEYEKAGAKLVSAEEAFASDIVLKVRPPQIDVETKLFQTNSG